MTLNHLTTGSSALIREIPADHKASARLAALGLATGSRVTLVRRAIGNGPLQIRTNTTDVILRSHDANHIRVSL